MKIQHEVGGIIHQFEYSEDKTYILEEKEISRPADYLNVWHYVSDYATAPVTGFNKRYQAEADKVLVSKKYVNCPICGTPIFIKETNRKKIGTTIVEDCRM